MKKENMMNKINKIKNNTLNRPKIIIMTQIFIIKTLPRNIIKDKNNNNNSMKGKEIL